MNFNYQFNKKDEKSWILKTVYGKHLLIFSDFLKSSCTPEIVSLSDQVARFFGLRISACPPPPPNFSRTSNPSEPRSQILIYQN